MDWDRVEGNWNQFSGRVKERWGRLTPGQIETIAGKRHLLAGKVQDIYGLTRENAERQVAEWLARQDAAEEAARDAAK